MTGPCHWNIVKCSDQPSGWVGLTPTERARYEGMAVDLLWRWTYRTFGICEVTIRPCKAAPARPSTFEGRSGHRSLGSGAPWQPALIGGQWFNISCGGCGGPCSCDSPATLRLPGPVHSVLSVTIDGVPLDPAAYRVDNYSLLVRQDGGGWPTSQDMDLHASAPGTFEVTYERGEPVPHGGQVAAGVLAVELWKAACNDSTCALPKRVQTVTRQGVTVAMLDSFENIHEGRTGIWLIDSWIASVTRPVIPSVVLSPDLPRHRRASS